MALTDNLRSYWKLDESSGNAIDALAVNTLTNTGTVTYGVAKINNGATISTPLTQNLGITDGSQTGLEPGSAYSVSGWVKHTSGKLTAPWSKYDNSASNNASFVLLWYSNDTMFVFTSATGSATQNFNTTSTFTDGTSYHHIVTVYDGAGATVKIYYDGVSQAGTQTGTVPGTLFDSNASFMLGAYNQTAGEVINVDEVGVWNRALTSGEVTTLYNGGAGIQYPFSSGNNLTLLGVGT